ncbi:MAG TPA: Hsp20/alpha crystallin family protein [Phycisphaerae bacterium]|nr:Hsp20/alpha crystallin family protein [Phycisphaerae bacterium]
MAKPIDVPVEMNHDPLEPPESYFVPATDVYETADELTLVAEMPGIQPAGLAVTVEDNVLVIRGRPVAEAETDGEVLLEEFTAGEFYRAFQLPADYDTERIEANLRQGVLTLTLPKSERLKPRRIEVKVD